MDVYSSVIFQTIVWSSWVLPASLLHLVLKHGDFNHIGISRCIAMTWVNCSAIFNGSLCN